MNIIENRGKKLEKFLTKALGSFLLPDFVIANPMVTFGSGKAEELADAIIPFLDRLVTMQFKSKKQHKIPSTLEEKDFTRILKKITEASKQAKTTARAYKQGLLKKFTNLRGIEMPIEPGIEEISSIIIIELEGEEKHNYYDRTRCIIQYIEEHGLSHHIFFLDDFRIILDRLDTIKDLWTYLEFRKELLSNKRLHYPFFETDLLGYFLFRHGEMMRAIKSDERIIQLENGFYFKEIEKGKDLIKKQSIEYAKHSLIIDGMINWIHTILDPRAERDGSEVLRKNAVGKVGWGSDVYYHLIKRYGSLCRLERYFLGKKLQEKMEKAEHSKIGFNFFCYPAESIPGHGFLIAATREQNLSKRYEILETLCFSAIHQTNIKEVTGVITDTLHSKSRSFQFACTIYDKKNQEEIEWHKNNRIFKEPERGTLEPWKTIRDIP